MNNHQEELALVFGRLATCDSPGLGQHWEKRTDSCGAMSWAAHD